MKNMKRILCTVLVLVMTLSVLAGCGKDKGSETTGSAGTAAPTNNAGTGENATYTVNVKSIGGMPLSGVNVQVYGDEALTDMKNAGQTGEDGSVSLTLASGGTYYIGLQGAPKGYQTESYYTFSGTTADITLTSSVYTEESLDSAKSLKAGDVMYDFTVTTPEGESITLSEMLKEKEVVVLNFWYVDCSACLYEFPYMQQAYDMYSEDVGIVAVNPFDDSGAISGYQASNGLTFPMATCPSVWTTVFGVSGYPTTAIIDRYGVICLLETGALVQLRYWTSIFDHFTGDDYEQKIIATADDLLTRVVPNETMPSSEEMEAVLNGEGITASYRADEDEYSWPFVITEKLGEQCVKSTNYNLEDSYSILYADVELKAGQAVSFDYLISSENGSDVLHVIVNDEPIYTISGVGATEQWETRYPWVADEDGTYEIAFCYIKDSDTNEGEDTAYIKNLRVCNVDEIDVATYLPREAAVTEDGFTYEYVDVVLNEEDNYYHVGTKDGPLLLANMMGYTSFSEEETLWDIAYDGVASDYYDKMVNYFSYASNSAMNGYCTVNKELGQLIQEVVAIAGFEGTEQEWLKLCCYYDAYGTETQLEDPIAGLAPFSAYTAVEGKNVETNKFTYTTIIMPRGKLAEFIPERSGVYRITSRTDDNVECNGWIFNENREELYCFEMSERLYFDEKNVSMLYYMEAGKPYYIDIAFYDVYGVGTIYYDIEYVASSYKNFRLCSPGYFTYDTNATGEAMYHLIAGGIDVVLGSDGKYYEKRADGSQGSLIYADFTSGVGPIGKPITTSEHTDAEGNVVSVKGLIQIGAFDFSKNENDHEILAYMDSFDNDIEATDEYLHELWGEDYDAYAEQYKLEEIYDGIYHGTGEDYTAEMEGYISKMITSGPEELIGCVVMDERLGEILQMLMDKFTFEDVDHSWTKLCFYYEYIGA